MVAVSLNKIQNGSQLAAGVPVQGRTAPVGR